MGREGGRAACPGETRARGRGGMACGGLLILLLGFCAPPRIHRRPSLLRDGRRWRELRPTKVIDNELVILLLLHRRILAREPWLEALEILLVQCVNALAYRIRDGKAIGTQ